MYCCHRTHNGAEVVICQHHVAGLLGNFSACYAHGNPDVSQLQGWGIIHAIPCHGCYLAHLFQQAHYVLLVAWLCTGEAAAAQPLQRRQTRLGGRWCSVMPMCSELETKTPPP